RRPWSRCSRQSLDQSLLVALVLLVDADLSDRRLLDRTAGTAGADGLRLGADAGVVVVVAAAAGRRAMMLEHLVAVFVAATVAVPAGAVNFGVAGCADEEHENECKGERCGNAK